MTSKTIPHQTQQPQQPPPNLNDIISSTSHQILLFSSQGTGVRQEVGTTLNELPYNPEPLNGQAIVSSAYIQDGSLTEYNFLNIDSVPGFDLYGTIIEADIDYTFYNSKNNYNNLLYVSIGPLGANNAPSNPNYVGTVRMDVGVYTPSQYAEDLKNALNFFYQDATNTAQDPFFVEYLERKRRFRINMKATTEELPLHIYDKYPVQPNKSYTTGSENHTAYKALGLRQNIGQFVPNYYANPTDKAYGKIGYWIIPYESEMTSPSCIDLRLTDAIQIASTYDAKTRNSNREFAEETTIVTSIAVPAILQANEIIPSTLSFKPNDFMYRSSFRINASSLTDLTFKLTDLKGTPINLNGGGYTLRIMVYSLPRVNVALQDAKLNTMESYLATIPQFSKKSVGGERVAPVVPPDSWIARLKAITLNDLKHKYIGGS
jgi:hypothetical protein